LAYVTLTFKKKYIWLNSAQDLFLVKNNNFLKTVPVLRIVPSPHGRLKLWFPVTGAFRLLSEMYRSSSLDMLKMVARTGELIFLALQMD